MLTDSNSTLVKRDQHLTGLAMVLDPLEFARVWGEIQGGVRFSNASIEYIRYKPHRRCIVLYRLSSDHCDDHVVACAHDSHSWAKHVRTHDGGTSDTNPVGTDALASLRISAGRFPCDRKLRRLSEIETFDRARSFVRCWIDPLLEDQPMELRRIAYKPAKRAVFHLRIGRSREYALKFFAKRCFTDAIRASIAWDNCRDALRAQDVLLPELHVADSHRQVIATRWIRGRNLAELMATTITSADTLRQVGRALAMLHKFGPNRLSKASPRDESLQRLAADVGTLIPELQARAVNYANTIQHGIVSCNRSPVSIHGDFYAKQIIVDDRCIGVLDFDQTVMGNPIDDLGNFVAKLHWSSLRSNLLERRLDDEERWLVEGYVEAAGAVSEAELNYAVAAGLFRCLPLPFRSGMEHWVRHTADLMQAIESRLNGVHEHRPHSRRVDYEAWTEESIPLSRKAIRASIRDCCPEYSTLGESIHVDAVVPIRHKPSRRCVLRVDLRFPNSCAGHLPNSLAAKLRFKGVDRHGYHVQTALWKAGLNRTNRDAVAVPRTLGIDESQRVWYQEWVPGEDMESIATVDSYRALAVAERSAQAIAVLHRTVTHLELKPYTINDEVSSLCEQLDTIRDRSPQYAAGVQEVIRWTSSICDRVKREEPCPIHRDFYPAQVIATRDCLFLCDFDLYCSGPPTLDAGNFLGHLWELSLRRRDQAAIWRDAAQRFTEAYVRTRSQSRSVRQRDCQIDHWAWLTLARQIVISTRISGRDHITPELIDATIRMARRLGKELLPEFPLP